MHAFLIIGNNPDEIEKEISRLSNSLKAIKMEFPLVKIEDTRSLKKFLQISSPQNRVIVIKNIHAASEEAQNAFLKSLEEPPQNLYFILTAENELQLLPTIKSRVDLIFTKNKNTVSIKDQKIVQKFISSSVDGKLTIISKISNREEAIIFITNFLIVGNSLLAKNPSFYTQLEEAQNTLSALKSNGNVQLQLTNFIAQITPLKTGNQP